MGRNREGDCVKCGKWNDWRDENGLCMGCDQEEREALAAASPHKEISMVGQIIYQSVYASDDDAVYSNHALIGQVYERHILLESRLDGSSLVAMFHRHQGLTLRQIEGKKGRQIRLTSAVLARLHQATIVWYADTQLPSRNCITCGAELEPDEAQYCPRCQPTPLAAD